LSICDPKFFLFFLFFYFSKKYFLYKRILGNLELSYNKLKYLKSFSLFFFINGNEQRQKDGRLKHTMMQKSRRRVGPYVSRLERLVTEKPKTHDSDTKNLSHTTTKLPSLSLDSYLAVLQISWVIPIECFQIFILLPQICAPSLLSGMEKCY
jgi:hypothetical protein